MVTDTNGIQLFLNPAIEERVVVSALNELLECCVETIDTPVEGAAGFLQITEYSRGFPQGLLVSLPKSRIPERDPQELAIALARKLHVTVLVEMTDTMANEEEWFLVNPSGVGKPTKTKMIGDGIEAVQGPDGLR